RSQRLVRWNHSFGGLFPASIQASTALEISTCFARFPPCLWWAPSLSSAIWPVDPPTGLYRRQACHHHLWAPLAETPLRRPSSPAVCLRRLSWQSGCHRRQLVQSEPTTISLGLMRRGTRKPRAPMRKLRVRLLLSCC